MQMCFELRPSSQTNICLHTFNDDGNLFLRVTHNKIFWPVYKHSQRDGSLQFKQSRLKAVAACSKTTWQDVCALQWDRKTDRQEWPNRDKERRDRSRESDQWPEIRRKSFPWNICRLLITKLIGLLPMKTTFCPSVFSLEIFISRERSSQQKEEAAYQTFYTATSQPWTPSWQKFVMQKHGQGTSFLF